LPAPYNAHPVNAAAAIATLEMLKNPEVYKQIDDVSNRLYKGLEKLFTEKSITHVLVKNASAFCSYFMEKEPGDLHDVLENHDFGFDLRYRRALIEKGIYQIPIACKQGSISYAHTNDDIDKTLEITREVLKSI
jgi:glutamate-1-semialdehyde 2,1-aminomutase